MGNLPSCVECMDDDAAFPRNPDNNGGMCDSVSMKPLPSNSTNGGTSSGLIPFTTETTEDIVQISTMKPLGVTLCDSDSTKGVFVTAIKPEGNVAKLTQPVSVGMLLLELNGVNVTSETLENVIKAISDSPTGKRLIMKFSGTKPVEKEEKESAAAKTSTTTTTASTTATTTGTDTVADPVSSEKKELESSEKKEDSSIEKKKEKETDGDNASIPSGGEKKVEQEQKKNVTDSGVESGKKEEAEKQEKQDEEEAWEKVSTPEKETFGDFASPDPNTSNSDDSVLSSRSMDTVEITPAPSPLKSGGGGEGGVGREDDLDNEFSNVNLGDDDEEEEVSHSATASASASVDQKQNKEGDKQVQQQQEQQASTSSSSSPTASTPQPGGADDVLTCHQCHADLPKESFSASQLKKRAKRKCKGCMQHASS